MTWNKERVFEFLREEPRIGRLATVTADGRPHVVPIWFAVSGDRILVHTFAGMKKARNVEATGRFALTVDTDEWPYRGVTLEGRARLEPEAAFGDRDPIERLAIDYLGQRIGGPMGRSMAGMSAEHTLLVLEPERWFSFDYS